MLGVDTNCWGTVGLVLNVKKVKLTCIILSVFLLFVMVKKLQRMLKECKTPLEVSNIVLHSLINLRM